MNDSYRIALAVKEYLVNQSGEDKLPLDMTLLDEMALMDVIEANKTKSAFGFVLADIEYCVDIVNDTRRERTPDQHGSTEMITYTEEFGLKVLDYINSKADASLGVCWETIQYWIDFEMGV